MKHTLRFLTLRKRLTMTDSEQVSECEAWEDEVSDDSNEDLMPLTLVTFFHLFLVEALVVADEENELILVKILR